VPDVTSTSFLLISRPEKYSLRCAIHLVSSRLPLHLANSSKVQHFTHLSFTFPLSAHWWSVSALRDIGHAICSRESLMIMSHAKWGTGGSDTRSERCRRPRLRAIVRPVNLGVHPSMTVTTITKIKLTTTHDPLDVFFWRNLSPFPHDRSLFEIWRISN
jgi:hypothetical protein